MRSKPRNNPKFRKDHRRKWHRILMQFLRGEARYSNRIKRAFNWDQKSIKSRHEEICDVS